MAVSIIVSRMPVDSPMRSTSSAVTAAMAAPRKQRAPLVLDQVAEGNRQIDEELEKRRDWPWLFLLLAIAWRGVTRMAIQAG